MRQKSVLCFVPIFICSGKLHIFDSYLCLYTALLLEDEEVLFVMFYAPWCGKSMHVKGEFEKAAHYLEHEVGGQGNLVNYKGCKGQSFLLVYRTFR